MKILDAAQIRLWDQYTIQQEPVSSADLMERAATSCVRWLEQKLPDHSSFSIFCGKGNNGGDGLVIARLLAATGKKIAVYILEFGHLGTDDFQLNLARLHQYPEVDIRFVQTPDHFYTVPPGDIIIDALFGSGLNRPLEGVTAALVEHLNRSRCTIVSIDLPSGLFADHSSKGNTIVNATHTLTFQCMKPALLVAENAAFTGKISLLDIGLHPAFYQSVFSPYELIDEEIIHSIYRPRKQFAHKGNFGHALLVAGSYGKTGAAVLAAKACLRAGVGLLTCHLPGCGYTIMQGHVPEAMVLTDFNSSFITAIEDDLAKYASVGIGPGLGQASETKNLLRELFDRYKKPMVLDADALNILAGQKDLLRAIPAGSILTPHPKEFARLFGDTTNDFDSIALAMHKAGELKSSIVLKGHHTLIATADGKAFFNTTGNAGMAKGGSGDVLTGMLTALLAQGYPATEAALLGVYLHGKAGDLAAALFSMEAMLPSDLIDQLGAAWLLLGKTGG